MTAGLERSVEIRFSPELALRRRNEIITELMGRHPESWELLNELDDLISTLERQAEEVAVVHHGRQIMAAIRGQWGHLGHAGLSNYFD